MARCFMASRWRRELIVRVLACLAEGLGIRATARVFEVDPNTVLQLAGGGRRAPATPFRATFCATCTSSRCRLDELYAVLSAVKDGEVSEDEAIQRLSRSPHWVWMAIDPV